MPTATAAILLHNPWLRCRGPLGEGKKESASVADPLLVFEEEPNPSLMLFLDKCLTLARNQSDAKQGLLPRYTRTWTSISRKKTIGVHADVVFDEGADEEIAVVIPLLQKRRSFGRIDGSKQGSEEARQ